MKSRFLLVLAIGSSSLLLAGCPKGNVDANQGDKAEMLQNYDAALDYFNRAVQQDPKNTEYRLKYNRVKFEAGQYHYQQGLKAREAGNLEMAIAQFRKSLSIDASSPIVADELKRTVEMLKAQTPNAAPATSNGTPPDDQALPGPPKITPLSTAPIDLKMVESDKKVFQTIGKLAGITVIFDPTLQPKPVTVELPKVTLEEALDIVALQSKTFWIPVSSNVVLVADDNQNNRRAYEDEVFQLFISRTRFPTTI